ncbi:SWIM-type domain-containing protein [Mycena sanguinolenta]|uniref:SWIM-type domain-containing protein n=1 Tax=Mycena sanguinolenta TaxID=230812 RepID=A0A8H6XYF4_9AGAR|nr:SWIM-type domain-containing protein [Mycena sanguinolenta]
MDTSPEPPIFPPGMKECNKSFCHRLVPTEQNNCDECREINRNAQRRKRAAAKAQATDPTTSRKRRASSVDSAEGRPTARLRTSEDDSPTRGNAEEAIESDDDKRGYGCDDDMDQAVETFEDAESFCEALKDEFKNKKAVDFHGTYPILVDPMVSPRARVEMVAREVWTLSGFRFTVKDHRKLKSGHHTRYWCSQDENRKKKSKASQNPGIRNRDTLGMKRFPCHSKLSISCRVQKDNKDILDITVRVKHAAKHVHYEDVALPAAALALIRDNVEWLTPVAMVTKIQAAFPKATAAQIHRAWTQMSEPFWRFDRDQLVSTKMLLQEHPDDVDIFVLRDIPGGVDALCWGMKKIATPLKGQIVEVGVDATYNTNSRHLELYSIMGEHDGAGFPLSYLFLSTASSIDQGKRTSALTAWAKCVRDAYGITATFAHVDKDMAEIKMLKDVWNAKISLCWWHLRRAVRTRLANSKLETTPYDPHRAHAEFSFIDVAFVPLSQADATEYEGGAPEIVVTPVVPPSQQPVTMTMSNGLRITIPAPGRQALDTVDVNGQARIGAGSGIDSTEKERSSGPTPPPEAMDVDSTAAGCAESSPGKRAGQQNNPVPSDSPRLIPTPAPPTRTLKQVTRGKENENLDTHEDEVRTTSRGRILKPTRNSDAADPAILARAMNARTTGTTAPTAKKTKGKVAGDTDIAAAKSSQAGDASGSMAAKSSAVDNEADTRAATSGSEDDEQEGKRKPTRRTFCPADYRERIVSMMEKHYCAHPLLPGYAHPSAEGIRRWAVLQMYKFCVEAGLREVWAYLWENWYRSSRWELWARSPPTFYRKLDRLLTDTGRYRELSSWRKNFKRTWRRLEKTPITLPVDPGYKTDAKKMICTCPSLAPSRFLLCKHVVQAFEPVPPVFFLEVKRQRTAPFWIHPSLQLTSDAAAPAQASEAAGGETTRVDLAADTALDSEDEDDDGLVDTRPDGDQRTFVEAMDEEIDVILEFAKGLKFQRQFRDQRMLQTLQREGASFLRLARACLGKEKRLRSTRGSTPSTWDKSTGSAMFYRARPAASAE